MAGIATAGFTTEFYNSLFDVADGENIKTCLQCTDCSGI